MQNLKVTDTVYYRPDWCNIIIECKIDEIIPGDVCFWLDEVVGHSVTTDELFPSLQAALDAGDCVDWATKFKDLNEYRAKVATGIINTWPADIRPSLEEFLKDFRPKTFQVIE